MADLSEFSSADLGVAFVQRLRKNARQLNHEADRIERMLADTWGVTCEPTESDTSDDALARPNVVLMDRTRRPEQATARPDVVGWSRRLRGLTQFQSVVKIAEYNGGVVRVTDARDIIVSLGRTKSKPSDVNGHLHRLLSASDRFEKIEPGVYRLLPPDRDVLETPASGVVVPERDRIEVTG